MNTKLDFGTTFQQAFELIKRGWKAILIIALIWGAIQGVIGTIIGVALVGAIIAAVAGGAATGGGMFAIGGGLIALVLGIFVLIFVSVAMGIPQSGMLIRTASTVDEGTEPAVGEAWSAVELGPLIMTGLVFGAIAAAACILLFIPILGWGALIFLGIYFGTRWSLTAAVVVFEGLSGMAAIKRSQEIVVESGDFWLILGIMVAGGVGANVATGIISRTLGVVLQFMPGDSYIQSFISFGLRGAATGVVAVLSFVVYRQLTTGTPVEEAPAMPMSQFPPPTQQM